MNLGYRLSLELAVPHRARLFCERVGGIVSGCGSLPVPSLGGDDLSPWLWIVIGTAVALALLAFVVARRRPASMS